MGKARSKSWLNLISSYVMSWDNHEIQISLTDPNKQEV